jgi:hypothetical protein
LTAAMAFAGRGMVGQGRRTIAAQERT